MSFKTHATIPSFGGKLLKLTHEDKTVACTMALNLYLPPQAFAKDAGKGTIPVLFYLSGLTCTGDNCAEKGFFQVAASERGIAVVYPDTSPRGLSIPGSEESYDFGTGASFYLNATSPPYTPYQMATYITSSLPSVLFPSFPILDPTRISITGHSMGGHGALTLFLKNPGMYKSVSAFAPICNPSKCPWGEKAFTGYLGEDRESWKGSDATELVKGWEGRLDVLIDVGTGDGFYKEGQLLPENFVEAARGKGVEGVVVRYQELAEDFANKRQGYDHSYYFISTFARDHVEHAAKYLFA
ncbi:hypothetical protein HYFRA_00003545 [Hymenoscyphus fraxineus]|uniref:S-formylglutathione hydrolase n=1 Tax=Hymenoscyphus fraxineus TaxID=746836 RepID=A0A9N9KTT0_9HELO|nr:hypothetical protein HYFRA_00003545 [Hymenoscyphus fraxineus]